jgi:hypothetical protein
MITLSCYILRNERLIQWILSTIVSCCFPRVYFLSFSFCLTMGTLQRVASTRERATLRAVGYCCRYWRDTILSCFCHVSFLLCFLSLPSTRRTKHGRSLDCTDFVPHVIRVSHLILSHTLQRWLVEPPYASFQHQFCGCSGLPRLQRVPSPVHPTRPAPRLHKNATQHRSDQQQHCNTLAAVVMASLNLQFHTR